MSVYRTTNMRSVHLQIHGRLMRRTDRQSGSLGILKRTYTRIFTTI